MSDLEFISAPSPNFNDRPEGIGIKYLILHYTGMESGEVALQRLRDSDAEVSAHYMIEEDGRIFDLVDDEKRAWHAGASFWAGDAGLNASSIGIEIVNPGHAHGYRGFPQDQVGSLTRLCSHLIHRHGIQPQHVLGHSDIAPERKWYDPGELFPWAQLAQSGVGVWPDPQDEDIEQAKTWSLDEYVAACRSYGYDPEIGYEFVLRAFERHFAPELILGTSQDEMIAKSRLACLIRNFCGTKEPRKAG